MRKTGLILLAVGGPLFLLGLFFRSTLPPPDDILKPLHSPPVQEALPPEKREPFSLTREDISYFITPRYSYTMHGLVVEEHDATGWLAYSHKLWGDYLNTRDLCVLWGANLATDSYRQFDYSHGEWTCYARTTDRQAAEYFFTEAFANNHILPASPQVAEAVAQARIGDQVALRGMLVDYGTGDKLNRTTSTSRNDVGDGACEVVYVEEFEVLKPANPLWRHAFSFGGPAAAFGLLLLVVAFFRSDNDSPNPLFYVERAETHAAYGDFRTALRDFDRALAISPGLTEAHRGKAVILEAMGHAEAAQEHRSAARDREDRGAAAEQGDEPDRDA